jgi:hypothetical protein
MVKVETVFPRSVPTEQQFAQRFWRLSMQAWLLSVIYSHGDDDVVAQSSDEHVK